MKGIQIILLLLDEILYCNDTHYINNKRYLLLAALARFLSDFIKIPSTSFILFPLTNVL